MITVDDKVYLPYFDTIGTVVAKWTDGIESEFLVRFKDEFGVHYEIFSRYEVQRPS